MAESEELKSLLMKVKEGGNSNPNGRTRKAVTVQQGRSCGGGLQGVRKSGRCPILVSTRQSLAPSK